MAIIYATIMVILNMDLAELVAALWSEFETKDNTYFAQKNKLVPKLPTSLLDLKDLPADYKLTVKF